MTRDERITRNLGLVHYVAKPYGGLPAPDYDDVLGDGMVGLVRAADTFDATRGASFPTWATWCIHSAIRDGLRQRDYLTKTHRQRVTAGLLPDLRNVELTEADEPRAEPLHHVRVDVQRAMQALTPRERRLVRRVHWLGLPCEETGLSRQRSSQVIRGAYRRLSTRLAGYRRAA